MEAKNLESSLRKKAASLGCRLVKSRRRNVSAIDYGRYWLVDERNVCVEGGQNGVELYIIEIYLNNEGGVSAVS